MRLGLALLLVLQIVYTPVHLCLEAHADEVQFSAAIFRGVSAAVFVDGEGAEGMGTTNVTRPSSTRSRC